MSLTAKQMVYEAKIFYEDIASNDAPSFTDREWSVLLTNAQNQFVQSIYRQGYDNNEESRIALQNLLKEYAQNRFESGPLTNSVILNLPNDFMYISYEGCNTTKKSNVPILSIPYDAYNINLSNPFKKPTSDRAWRIIGSKGKNFLISIDEINFYGCVYISRPEPIIVSDLNTPIEGTFADMNNCKLHANTHRPIAHLAAKLAYGATQEQLGYQIQNIESIKS